MDDKPRFDELVGQNLQELRKARGLSQADLADALTTAGYAFSQQTILKIEKGTRPLKLEEAIAISERLGLEGDTLWKTGHLIGPTTHVLSAVNEVNDAWSEVLEATARTYEALSKLASWVDAAGNGVPKSVLNEAEGFLALDLEKSVAARLRELELRKQAEDAAFEGAVTWDITDA